MTLKTKIIATDTASLVKSLNTRLESLGLTLKVDTTQGGILDTVAFIASKMDNSNLAKLARMGTPEILAKVENAAKLCGPDNIFIYTGTKEDVAYIKQQAIEKGEEGALPNYKPNHRIHHDLPQEQGRLTKQTFYLAEPGQEISSSQNRMDRTEGLALIANKMSGMMKGKTMFVSLISRGPIGSHGANPALGISSSTWVLDNARLLYRDNFEGFDADVAKKGYYFTNIHSEGTNTPEGLKDAGIFMDLNGNRFQDETTYSFGTTYAGNTLLFKKGHHRFAINKAIYQNRGQELAEHMFITAIEDHRLSGTKWIAGAAPSGCGKTTTAMAGTKFIGDDLAQMWIENGKVRSVNPEDGVFAIVEDSNQEGDPMLMDVIRNSATDEVLWSNVLIDPSGTPRYVNDGLGEYPASGTNYQGLWINETKDAKGNPAMFQRDKFGSIVEKDGEPVLIPMSHPNSRATVAGASLANYDVVSADNPDGVDTTIFTYSGRDADTMPPVWKADTIIQGVAIGANIVSKATATEVGASGVKRAPWANLPFNPGLAGDYMDAQIKFFGNTKIEEEPTMAGLNYFLTDEARGGKSSDLLGEKKDVKVWLKWLALNDENVLSGISSPIGTLPKFDDLKNLFTSEINKEYSQDLYDKQFSLYTHKIIARIDMQVEAYGKEENVPEAYFTEMSRQKAALLELSEKYGDIVTPDQLAKIQ